MKFKELRADVIHQVKKLSLTNEAFRQDNKKLPRIYCDMDGVLCNFEQAAQKAVKMPLSQWAQEPKKVFKTIRDKWQPIMQTKNFWSTLPWNPGGQQLWSFISKHDPHILSAYVEQTSDPSCIPGKSKWARTKLGMSGSKVNLVKRREKQNFAKVGGMPTILIDDYIKNINQFRARGGIGIHHTSAAKTISELRKLGFK
jgi:hypothetical protein|tara:strand:+ start:173 stop:769 length:597 start_codon:yes stop_codon:yes gene_type:complete